MGIIIKYTFRSIKEKKFRTFLIVLSILLSVALSLSSFALRDVAKNSIVEMVKKYFGTANIMVRSSKHSESNLVRINDLGEVTSYFDYQVGAIEMDATYKGESQIASERLTVRGYNEEDFAKLGNVSLDKKLGVPFNGKVIYISEKLASDNDWSLGSFIELTINNQKHKVQVAGIGKNSGALESSNQQRSGVMPSSALRKIYNIQDRYFYILLKSKEGVSTKQAMEELKKVYPRYKIDEPIPWSQIEGALNNVIVPFVFMLLLVLATSIFIIYTAFKVITTEKLPVLGTFRSIGANKKTVDFILLGEALFYGIFGGILGVMLGRFILKGIGIFMTSSMGSSASPSALTHIHVNYYIFAMLFGIILSLASAIVPILQVSKLSVRDIVLGFTQSLKDRSKIKMVIGIVLVVLAMIIPFISGLNGQLLLNLLATIMLCMGIMFLVPTLTQLILVPLSFLAGILFGNLGRLSIKNINGNKNILNNISLLTIGLASIILINILSATLAVEFANAYKAVNFNIYANIGNNDRSDLVRIKNMAEVDKVFAVYSKYNTKVKGTDISIAEIDGAPDQSFFDYWQFDITTDTKFIKENLGITRSIILSNALKNKLKVSVGDVISLELQEKKTLQLYDHWFYECHE